MDAHHPVQHRPAPAASACNRSNPSPGWTIAWVVPALLAIAMLCACAHKIDGEFTRSQCGNGWDDDDDGLKDCLDPDCAVWATCSPQFLGMARADGGWVDGGPADADAATDAAARNPECDGGPCDAGAESRAYELRIRAARVATIQTGGTCADPCAPPISIGYCCVPDPYVVVFLDGQEIGRSATALNSEVGMWDTASAAKAGVVLGPGDGGRLLFVLMDDNTIELDDARPDRLQEDRTVFECSPSLEALAGGILGCSHPDGDGFGSITVQAVAVGM